MKRTYVLTSLIVLAMLLAVGVGASLAAQPQNTTFAPVAQGNDNNGLDGGGEITVESAAYLNYQGRLLQGGSPYNGTINITFRLYQSASGGSAWWQETQTVNVSNGLFSVNLGAVNPLDGYAEQFGDQNWLGIQPAGASAELTPRQPLSTAAYAFGLIPGVSIYDTNSGGSEDHYWHTFWVSADNHPAARFASDTDYAIWASTYTDTFAIHAYSSYGTGVYGYTGDTGFTSQSYGVFAEGDGMGGRALYALKTGGSGVAGKGYNQGSTGSGMVGQSVNYVGTWGETDRSDNYFGFYTPDYMYALGYTMMGAQMQVVQNGGDQPLEAGDVVVFSGIAAPLVEGGAPVVQVSKATQANSTAVAGVVYSAYNLEMMLNSNEEGLDDPSAAIAPAGPVAPGGYLLIVVQGPALVKAEAIGGAIQPGTLLASGPTAGYAVAATNVSIEGVSIAVPGTVFAKALESLAEGQKMLYVFVTLH